MLTFTKCRIYHTDVIFSVLLHVFFMKCGGPKVTIFEVPGRLLASNKYAKMMTFCHNAKSRFVL